MSYYCTQCGDKLETFEVMKYIESFDSGGSFSNPKITWKKGILSYCDNQECEWYGKVLALAPISKPTPTNKEGK